MKKIEVDEFQLEAMIRDCKLARDTLLKASRLLFEVKSRAAVLGIGDGLLRADMHLRAMLRFLEEIQRRLFWAEEVDENDD